MVQLDRPARRQRHKVTATKLSPKILRYWTVLVNSDRRPAHKTPWRPGHHRVGEHLLMSSLYIEAEEAVLLSECEQLSSK